MKMFIIFLKSAAGFIDVLENRNFIYELNNLNENLRRPGFSVREGVNFRFKIVMYFATMFYSYAFLCGYHCHLCSRTRV